MSRKCEQCDGLGYLDDSPDGERAGGLCHECHGTGYEPISDTCPDDAYEQSTEDEDADIDF